MDNDKVIPLDAQLEWPTPQSLLIAFLIMVSVLCVGFAYVVFLLWVQDKKLAAWMRTRDRAHGGKPAREVTCRIMLDQHLECECILSPEGHAISRSALQQYVAMEVKKPVTTHQKRGGCIKCPVPECATVLPERGMALHCTPDTYGAYTDMKQKVASQNAFEKALEDHPELSE